MKKYIQSIFVVGLLLSLALMLPLAAQDTEDLPTLTEPGPYDVGRIDLTFVDASRDRELETSIWYPAQQTQVTPTLSGIRVVENATPNQSGAPYPLIIYSHDWGSTGLYELMDVKVHLASYGYVVAAAEHPDAPQLRFELLDRPLDILVILDNLAAINEGDLAGVIDTDNVGLMGWALGANASLQMLGLLRDPVHARNWCSEHPRFPSWDCGSPPTKDYLFDEITTYRTRLGLENMADGRWAAFSDERVRAVLALSPGDFPLTTEDMLVAVTTPTMILHGTSDYYHDYENNAVRTYTHLGTEDRYLLSLVHGGHQFFDFALLNQFSTAFFGLYLQGDETYRPYLTKEHAETWRTVVWGPVEDE